MHRNAVAYRFGEKYDTNSLSAVPLFCFSEMEAVMNQFEIDALAKIKITRELDGLRSALEPEPEPEPKPEPEPEPEPVVVAQKLVVCGGRGANGSSVLNSCEMYDPSTGSWTSTGNLNEKRHYACAGVI